MKSKSLSSIAKNKQKEAKMKKQKFLRQITIGPKQYSYYDINLLDKKGVAVKFLPFSIRILVENIFRNLDDKNVLEKDLYNIVRWRPIED